MKFLVVAVVCVCMFIVHSAEARPVRRVLRVPVRITKKVIPSPRHSVRNNVSCRIETRKARRVSRRSY